MSRRPREDAPGALHHVFNRGAAKRTIFESRRDMRTFLALIAQAARRAEIEVYAYCLLGTHFHLFLRSNHGRLGEAMQRIQTVYSRYFNRGRRRDGSLVRGRFGSRRVMDEAYVFALVRYIELNPVQAGIVGRAEDYEFSSASARGLGRRPRWLRSMAADGIDLRLPRDFGHADAVALAHVVERRMTGAGPTSDFDFPSAPGNDSVRRWLVRKAALADGTRPGLPVCDPRTVASVVAEVEDASLEACGQESLAPQSQRRQLLFGLLRDIAGLGLAEIGRESGISASAVAKVIHRHRLGLAKRSAYLDLVSRAAREAYDRGPMGLLKRASLPTGLVGKGT